MQSKDVDLSKANVSTKDPRVKWDAALSGIPVGKARPLSEIAKSVGASMQAANQACKSRDCLVYIKSGDRYEMFAINPKSRKA